MSVLGRRMTPELLAAELLRGLESGEVVFDEHMGQTVGAGVEELRAVVAEVAVAVATASTFDEMLAILTKAVQTAERLRHTALVQPK